MILISNGSHESNGSQSNGKGGHGGRHTQVEGSTSDSLVVGNVDIRQVSPGTTQGVCGDIQASNACSVPG